MRTGWLVLALLCGIGCRSAPARPRPAAELYRPLPHPPAEPQVPPGPIAVATAVDLALAHYPSIRAAQARADAAGAGVNLADTAYLPRLDFLWQEVRATRNNISGQFIPQPIVPAISGPVGRRSSDNAWGSAAGLLLSYEPFDFGFRGATVDAAVAAARQAGVEVELTRLDVATTAIETFIVLVAAQETARAAQANVERWDVFRKAVRALVDQQLRPGVDASRADAEYAQAQTQLLLAQQVVDVGRATLAEALGLANPAIKVDPGPLLENPSGPAITPPDLALHPLLKRQGATLEAIQARERALDKAYYPRLNLQFSLSDRGSGFGSNGQLLDPDDGLFPDHTNWVAGVTLTFPAMELFQLRARSTIEEGNERAERARTDQIILNLKMQDWRIRSILDTAQRIAQNTPVQLKAAQETHTRARARYDSGLGTLTEVADAQRLLAQSEIDDALARLGIWRALSAAARVQGDVKPFLQVVSRTPKKEK